MIKAFTYRLYPSPSAAKELLRLRAIGCWLWNACLQQRIEAYQRQGLTLKGAAQSREITGLKADCAADPSLGVPWGDAVTGLDACPRTMLTDVLDRLDGAFAAFFRRLKTRRSGEAAGFPKFKARRQWSSVGVQYGNGIRLQEQGAGMVVLTLYWGVGARARRVDVRCYLHRPVQGRPKHAVIEERADGWHLILQCDEVDPVRERETGAQVGVDVGLTTFAALSTGEMIDNPRPMAAAADLLARVQRRGARQVKGSKRWHRTMQRVAKIHLHVANQRKDFQHKTARDLVRRFDTISVEGLNLKGLVRSKLARPIADAGWGQFLTLLAGPLNRNGERNGGKAAEAGKTVVVVDPRGTSQECSRCGEVVRKHLSVRVHRCPKCNLRLDRDVNAAVNILQRGETRAQRRADGPLLDVEGKGSKQPLRSVNDPRTGSSANGEMTTEASRRGESATEALAGWPLDLPLWKRAAEKGL